MLNLADDGPLPVHGPVVVAGLGGSGTRVVAQVLRDSGFYLGTALNDALDNLWFSLLFKRPRQFGTQRSLSDPTIALALDLFERAMLFGLNDIDLTEEQAKITDYRDHSGLGPLRAQHAAETFVKSSPPELANSVGWGWKEPNAHLFLEHLAVRFPTMRFVYLIRNGLDMALSPNQQQCENWSSRFDIDPNMESVDRAMEFWLRSTERVLSIAADLLVGRFHLVRFDDLVSEPELHLRSLADFLGQEWTGESIERLALPISPPSSIGRHRSVRHAAFTPERVETVRALGFRITNTDPSRAFDKQ